MKDEYDDDDDNILIYILGCVKWCRQRGRYGKRGRGLIKEARSSPRTTRLTIIRR